MTPHDGHDRIYPQPASLALEEAVPEIARPGSWPAERACGDVGSGTADRGPGFTADRSKGLVADRCLGLAWLGLALDDGDRGAPCPAADAARAAWEHRREAAFAAGAADPLDAIAVRFGLSRDDTAALFAAASVRVQSNFAGFAPLGLDRARALAPRARLSPQAPLRRMALMDLLEGPGGAGQALWVDERVAAAVFGERWLDPRVACRLRLLAAAPSPAAHRAAITACLNGLPAEAAARFVLTGRPGSGRRAGAQALAGALGREAVEVATASLPAVGEERRRFWRLLGREALLSGLMPVLDAEALGEALFDEAWSACEAPLIALSHHRRAPPGGAWHIALAPLTEPCRRECWTAVLGPARAEEATNLARAFGLGPTEILRVAEEAVGDPDRIRQVAREIARTPLDALAERIVPEVGIEDIVLPTEAKAALRALITQARHGDRVHRVWGMRAGTAGGRGIAALLAGRPGVGKTLAAEAVAKALDRDLCRIDLSSVISKYIGETEKSLARIFDAAEASGCVLLFDEAEALFGKRTEVREARDRWANTGVCFLLQRIERFGGLCLLATNLKGHIDSAFLRRLRFVIDIPFPSAEARAEIWRRAFPPAVPTEGLDHERLAELELAGGSIALVAVNAAFLAAEADGAVTMDHIRATAMAEYAKIDRLFPARWPGGGAR